MINRLKRGSVFSIMILMTSCITMQPQQLSNNGITNQKKDTTNAKLAILNSKIAQAPDHWYACIPGKPMLNFENNILKVGFTASIGECFGIWFSLPMDVTKTPVINVKASYTSKNEVKDSDMLVCFTDTNKNITNIPAKKVLLRDGKGLMEYSFDYNNEIKQKDSKFDFSKIVSILFFINITGNKDNTGDLVIEEISLSENTK